MPSARSGIQLRLTTRTIKRDRRFSIAIELITSVGEQESLFSGTTSRRATRNFGIALDRRFLFRQANGHVRESFGTACAGYSDPLPRRLSP